MSTSPKPFVFVLMPFDNDFDDAYKLGIKPACEAAGTFCQRVDEQIFTDSVLDRIYNQIAKADVIVAEMSGRNPNVFYETGYAHALGKHVILLTRDAEDIPFDLKHYPHIVYQNISQLKKQLEPRIQWCVENPSRPATDTAGDIHLHLNGERLVEGSTVDLTDSSSKQWGEGGAMEIVTRFSIHNAGFNPVTADRFFVAIVFPSSVIYVRPPEYEIVTLPGDKRLIQLGFSKSIPPGGWRAYNLRLGIERIHELGDLECSARISAELGRRDFSFTLRLWNRGTPDRHEDGTGIRSVD